METERITKVRKVLEIITFSVIFTVMINSFFGTNFIRKIKNNDKGIKVYYLMDFRLLGAGSLNEGRVNGSGCIEI